MGQEICASFPYSIGSGLPSHLQEPWAALIDSGAVTSIAPSSLAPHVPITPHSGQLVNVNGGEIKIKGQKKVTYVTHMVIMHITFLVVEDVLNPTDRSGCPTSELQFSFTCFRPASLLSSTEESPRQFFTIASITTMPQVLFFQDLSKVQYSSGMILQHTIFDPQSTSQIIAEIDFEINSEARLTQSQEEDVSMESQKPQCLKTPESVTTAEREAHLLTHMPFCHGALYVSVPKVNISIKKGIKSSQVSFN